MICIKKAKAKAQQLNHNMETKTQEAHEHSKELLACPKTQMRTPTIMDKVVI